MIEIAFKRTFFKCVLKVYAAHVPSQPSEFTISVSPEVSNLTEMPLNIPLSSTISAIHVHFGSDTLMVAIIISNMLWLRPTNSITLNKNLSCYQHHPEYPIHIYQYFLFYYHSIIVRFHFISFMGMLLWTFRTWKKSSLTTSKWNHINEWCDHNKLYQIFWLTFWSHLILLLAKWK